MMIGSLLTRWAGRSARDVFGVGAAPKPMLRGDLNTKARDARPQGAKSGGRPPSGPSVEERREASEIVQSLPADASLSRLAELRKRFPRWPGFFHSEGRLLLNLGWADRAEAVFRDLEATLPDDPQALFGLAECAQRRGDVDLARRRWRRAAAEHPAALQPQRGLASVAAMSGDLSEAVSIRRQLADREDASPLDRYLHLLVSHEAAGEIAPLAAARALAATAPADEALAHVHARYLLQRGRLRELLSFSAEFRAKAGAPANFTPLETDALLGAALPERALELSARFIAGKPGAQNGLVNHASILRRVSGPREALSFLKAACGASAGDSALIAMSGLATELEDFDAAIGYARRAAEVSGGVAAHFALGRVLIAAEKADDARAVVADMETRFRANADGRLRLAQLHAMLGNFAAAREWLGAHLSASPASRDGLRELHHLQWRTGDVRRAWLTNLAVATCRPKLAAAD